MELVDYLALLHPFLAVVVVFPTIGIVLNMAWQTRSRRLQTQGGKSKIPAVVGREHVKYGQILTGTVVGITLIALAYSIFVKNIVKNQLWVNDRFQVVFMVILLAATIASLVFLYQARSKLWRGVFATLTGMGLVVLGCQEGVFRRTYEWQISHYYYGIAAALLMVFSLAIVNEIYQDRSQRWRLIHTLLNCFALLLFIGQGFTGARDLLEIPLSWQQEHLYRCNWEQKICPSSESSAVPLESLQSRRFP
ncbi:MAG: DUF4079 domain-containing protein [Cyanobacteria bacterium J007]|nr:MAG: DUF4079 domain-containing protein [Cyanobacteria bacterium J007]